MSTEKEFKLISNCNLCSSRLKCAICLGFVCFFIDLSLARKQNSKFQFPNYKFNLFVHVNKVDRIMVLGLVRTDSIRFDWFFHFNMDISLFTICRPPIVIVCMRHGMSYLVIYLGHNFHSINVE